MSSKETIFWGIHVTGANGDSLFLKDHHIGIGWPEVGDLKRIKADRDAFKAKVGEVYRDTKRGWVINSASQLYRFVHEMKHGEYIIYRSKFDQRVHIGILTGDYKHDPGLCAEYPNVRPVKWLGDFPITRFSQGALYELGSALTLFQVTRYADEYQSALAGETRVEPESADETVAVVTEDIEQATRDFVLKQLARETKGYPLQAFVADVLRTMGFRSSESPVGPDGGVDLVAHRDELKLEPPIMKVQVKSTEGSVSGPDVRAFYANVAHNEVGLVVTLGKFARQAEEFAKGKSNLRLINGTDFINLVLAHYEDLDPRFKAILPLKRVYVPRPPLVEEK